MFSTKHLICIVLTIFFGLCFLIGGIITIFIFPALFANGIIENKLLVPSSKSYDQWVEPSIPIYMELYYFNCTNIEAFIHNQTKPNLVELGPYIFREHRKKVDIETIGDNYIKYNQQNSWTFEPELSSGSLSDVINTINVPAWATSYKSRNKIKISKMVADGVIKGQSSLYVSRTVEEFTFDGYNDGMLNFGNEMYKLNVTKEKVPEKFGWFYEKNQTIDGPFVVNNGKKNIQNVGYIRTYKNMTETPFFPKYYNYINGTAGDVFPPFMYENNQLEFFASGLCRTVNFVYDKTHTVDELLTRRFVPKPYFFDVGVPDREGLLNLSSCRENAPIFISFPHFLHANESYRNAVSGLNPDPEKHQFVMDIQPDLGIPVNVAARFQVNVLIRGEEDFQSMENFSKEIFFPMFWFTTSARLDEATVEQLKYVTIDLPKYIAVVAYVFIAVGVVMTCSVLIMLIVILCITTPQKQMSQGKTYELAATKDISAVQQAKEKEASQH